VGYLVVEQFGRKSPSGHKNEGRARACVLVIDFYAWFNFNIVSGFAIGGHLFLLL
jgi:hypothetical protein